MTLTSFRWLLIVVAKFIYFVDANWITGNLCWSMPCMNGGSCFGSAYTYLCVCPVNFSGSLCEKRLGICQESPCGNRGLCVETGLTSFECRCYFDYMGPLCEEHVPKNDHSVWSSLIPVHTRVLFDILQEAYRAKVHGRSTITSNNGQIDFFGLLPSNDVSSSSATTLSTTFESTSQSETTEEEHIIPAEDIQLEKIFPEISTASTSDIYTEKQTTQQDDSIMPTYLETHMTSTMMTLPVEDTTTTMLPLTTMENMMTISLEQNQTTLNITDDQESVNITEQFNTMTTLTPWNLSNYNSDNNTTEMIQNITEYINDTTESGEFLMNITSQTLVPTSSESSNYLSIQTDDNLFNTSEPTMIITDQPFTTDKSVDTVNISQTAHSQLLYKLCKQLLSHILPNASSSTAAVEAVLSLASTGNNTASTLLTWIKEQFSSSTTTPSTSSLLINGKKLSSDSLQRVDMDDVLYQMNNNIDDEH